MIYFYIYIFQVLVSTAVAKFSYRSSFAFWIGLLPLFGIVPAAILLTEKLACSSRWAIVKINEWFEK